MGNLAELRCFSLQGISHNRAVSTSTKHADISKYTQLYYSANLRNKRNPMPSEVVFTTQEEVPPSGLTECYQNLRYGLKSRRIFSGANSWGGIAHLTRGKSWTVKNIHWSSRSRLPRGYKRSSAEPEWWHEHVVLQKPSLRQRGRKSTYRNMWSWCHTKACGIDKEKNI